MRGKWLWSGLLVGVLAVLSWGLIRAWKVDQQQRVLVASFEEALARRSTLIANVIYLAKTTEEYPDVGGAAQLFQTKSECEHFSKRPTREFLKHCDQDLRELLRAQRQTLGEQLRESSKAAHWMDLERELDRAEAAIVASCRLLAGRYEAAWVRTPEFRFPQLVRVLMPLIATYDWAEFSSCQ
jgi:hypothetical protein